MNANFSRRSLLTKGAVGAAVVAVPALPMMASADEPVDDPNTLVGKVVQVLGGGSLLIRIADGTELELTDPIQNEAWAVGDKLVVELAQTDPIQVLDIQRMYESIVDRRVVSRNGNLIETDSGTLRIADDSEPVTEGDFLAVPLSEIGPNDIVRGLGYGRDGTSGLFVAQLGVKAG